MDNTKKAILRYKENGSLEISGDFSIQGINGELLSTDKTVYLCRCGKTTNKPFCDGSHKKDKFIK